MGGEAIGRCGVEGKGKETVVLLLREDERRPSWSFGSKKMRRFILGRKFNRKGRRASLDLDTAGEF
jgi:hypothetical protein